jgi:hypothetical protein
MKAITNKALLGTVEDVAIEGAESGALEEGLLLAV